MRKTTDILISGGGVAGLTAAAAFGSAGFEVLCIEPTPPVTDATSPGADLRTTAFLTPSIAVLEAAGLWQHLAAPIWQCPLRGHVAQIKLFNDSHASVESSWDFGVGPLKKTIKIHKWLQLKELSVNLGFHIGYLLGP